MDSTTPNTPPTLRMRQLFERVADLSPEQRAAELRAAGASADELSALATLLEADRQQRTILDTPALDLAKALDCGPSEIDAMIGQQIGPYRILTLLGTGGSSIVFRATRMIGDAEQTVALKLLHHGLFSSEARRRFRREQSILAQVVHPNIARLIDGGVTEAGIPYIALELVDGIDLISYANVHTLARDRRLRLLEDLCRAVDAAHRALVVHRDLKPSNVLVTAEGQVKVLDFGIAKLLDDDQPATATQHIALTPGYAAPEQYRHGPSTTAADVYALGVLAGELLLGFRLGPDATRQDHGIDERATRRRWRNLDAELVDILRAALASEPDLRYSSAGHLADDVVRYLRREPLAVSPPSTIYRARKFVARHRTGVVIAGALVIAAVFVLVVTLWQASLIRHQMARANAARGFIEDMFEPIENSVVESKQMSVHDLLANATAKLEKNVELSNPERIDLQLMFSRLHERMGEPDDAMALASRAASLAIASLPANDALRLDAEISQAYSLVESNRSDEAGPLLRALEKRVGNHGVVEGMALVRLYDGLADIADRHGEHSEALQYERLALDERIARFGSDNLLTAAGYNNVAISLDLAGRHDDAIEAYRRAVKIQMSNSGPDSFDAANSRANLGFTEMLAGRLAAAREDLLAVQSVFDSPPNNKRNRNAHYWQNRCALAITQGTSDAETACLRSLQASQELLRGDLPRSVRAWRLDAQWKTDLGDLAGARDSLQQANVLLGGATRNGPWLAQIDYCLAVLDLIEGKTTEALTRLASSIENIDRQYPPYMRLTALSLRAQICNTRHDVDSAVCPATAVSSAREEVDAQPDHWRTPLLPAHIALARVDLDSGRNAAALQRLRSAISRAEREVDPSQIRLVEARLWSLAAQAGLGMCSKVQSEVRTIRQLVSEDYLAGNPLLDAVRTQLLRDGECSGWNR